MNRMDARVLVGSAQLLDWASDFAGVVLLISAAVTLGVGLGALRDDRGDGRPLRAQLLTGFGLVGVVFGALRTVGII